MRCFLIFFLLSIVVPVHAEELDVRSNPERDELFVTVSTAIVELKPGDDDFVRVSYDCVPEEAGSADDNLKVVSAAGSGPSLRRTSRKITLRFADEVGECRVLIAAPPTLATRLRIEAAGTIDVHDWRSSLTAWSAAGDITVHNQSGSFSVTAMSGDATVEYGGDSLDSASAITAASGTLVLALPGMPDIRLQAMARWGDVLTDLDVNFIEEVGANGTWSITETGDGGPTVTLRNLNESIRIVSSLEP